MLEEDKQATDFINQEAEKYRAENEAAAEQAEADEIAQLEESAKAEKEAAEKGTEVEVDPLAELDLTQIAVTRQVKVEGSKDLVEVTESADKLKRRLDKRRNIVAEVAKCLAG